MEVRHLIILAWGVVALCGCSTSDTEEIAMDRSTADVPVAFSTFLSSTKQETRAGGSESGTAETGSETNETGSGTTETGTGATGTGTGSTISSDLKTLRSNGFGVFAVNTETTSYNDWRKANNPTTSGTGNEPSTGETTSKSEYDYANYMFNQAVTWPKNSAGDAPADDGQWSYSPIKYWPNPTLDSNTGNANPQYVSFFAYSPYVSNLAKYTTPTSGTETKKGILGYSFNEYGDPLIAFNPVGSDVDLLFGGAGGNENGQYCNDEGTTNSNVGKNVDNSSFNVNADIAKMKTDGKLKFNFKHALSKFNLTADTKIGENLATVDPNSKVMIDYIVMVMKTKEGTSVPTVSYLNLATGKFSGSPDGSAATGDDELTNVIKAKDKENEEILEGLPTADATKNMNTEIASVTEGEIKTAAGGTGEESSTGA